jgi:outer membrane protein TolC
VNDQNGGIFLKRLITLAFGMIFVLGMSRFGILAAAQTNNSILETKQAEEEALAADLSLQAAKLDLEIAQKDWEAARRILSAGGFYSAQQTSTGDLSLAQGLSLNSGGTFDSSAGNVYSKWAVTYTPGDSDSNTGIYNLNCYPFNLNYEKSIKTAELNLANKYLGYENTRIKLIMDVRNLYAEVVQKEEIRQLAGQNLELVKDQLKKSNSLFTAGKIPRLDVMDIEQQVKAAETKLVSADLNHQAGLLKLSALLRNDNLSGLALRGESLAWAVADQIDIQGTIAQCLKNSPELKTALLNVEVARLQNLTDAFYLLKNINVGAGFYKDKTGNDVTFYRLGFTGSLDDEYFRNKNASRKRLEAAQFNLEVADRNKRAQILETYRNWKIMELNLAPMQESLNIATERLRIAQMKYENGMASGSDVNQANLTLTQAQENYWNTWLSLQQARESFYQATLGNTIFKREGAK